MPTIRQKVNNQDHCESGIVSYYVDDLPEGWNVTWNVGPIDPAGPVPPFEVSGPGDSEIDIDVSGLPGDYAGMVSAVACVTTPAEI